MEWTYLGGDAAWVSAGDDADSRVGRVGLEHRAELRKGGRRAIVGGDARGVAGQKGGDWRGRHCVSGLNVDYGTAECVFAVLVRMKDPGVCRAGHGPYLIGMLSCSDYQRQRRLRVTYAGDDVVRREGGRSAFPIESLVCTGRVCLALVDQSRLQCPGLDSKWYIDKAFGVIH